MSDPARDPVCFADILTTASAVAHYLGAQTVTASHLLDAVAIQRGIKTISDVGRPVSPLVPGGRSLGTPAPVEPAVRLLVQGWFERLGRNPRAILTAEDLAALIAETERLAGPAAPGHPGGPDI